MDSKDFNALVDVIEYGALMALRGSLAAALMTAGLLIALLSDETGMRVTGVVMLMLALVMQMVVIQTIQFSKFGAFKRPENEDDDVEVEHHSSAN